MPYEDEVLSLVTLLNKAGCFEDAAIGTHKAVLACAHEALMTSPYASRGRILRSVVHLRPGGNYQRLFGVEHASGELIEGNGYLTSANVWQWVQEHACSVSIDTQLGATQAWLPDGPVRRADQANHASVSEHSASAAPGADSRIRMLQRDSTHVHVIPLRKPGGAVSGMIAIEARCKPAMGRDFIWDDCYERLEVLVSVAAPFLYALPPKQSDTSPPQKLSDRLLPVVGVATAGIIKLLKVFAQQQETILISGPTGSGKSRLARWCHTQSLRNEQPFETLDLLSVPEELQMAELFGWKRGAFTGAVKSNPGALARAAGGTLFIDEIDKLSLKAQAGLLRVLEEQSYRPLGDDGEERHANIRFIIGTNVDLRAAVRDSRFREDLYYRIHVLPVRLPPLADRLDELPRWADFMLQRRHADTDTGGAAARLAPEAVDRLMVEPWPGNLRQLDNLIRRAYVFAVADLPTPDDVLLLQRQHVEQALSFEALGPARSEDGAPLALLWRAACVLVGEAERRKGDAAVTLELSGGFRGLVLLAAEQRLGSREAAFSLLGEQRLLDNRNHHRAYRRELERTRALIEAVGGHMDDDLAKLLAG